MGKTEQFDNEVGLDADALVYEMDRETTFELADGTFLKGQSLIDHLIQTNDILKDKIHLYCRKCDDLEEAVFEERSKSYKKLQSVRSFYCDMIFGGNSRGAKMLTLYCSNFKKFHCYNKNHTS